MTDGFGRVLDHIRSIAGTEVEKGRLFERLMKAYFQQDPLYRDRFSYVRLWSEWAATRPDFDGADIGIDLVAEERAGGVCAIQCKCYAPDTRISKAHLDSFISASAREPFTARIVVDTGDGWGPNAVKTVTGLDRECTVLRFGDLASRPFDWPDLVRQEPEALSWRAEPYRLRPHQQSAFDDTIAGFVEHDRGKLIMACGTGKTFAALRIAEALAGVGGRVLYLVPSISLFQQSMREWAEQRSVPHRYVGICSDTRAGRNDEDATLQELEIPVTTDPAAIGAALRNAPTDAMTAVFCTYHSLGLVGRAQDDGAPPFDLVLCDEAHRTTGVERPGDRTSPFVLVHDAERIRAGKRLYMTATPRIYTEGARVKAASHNVRSLLDGRSGHLRAGVPPLALLAGGRAGSTVRLQGRRARHVRTACGRRVAGAPGGRRRRDQPHRRGEDRRLLARAAEPRGTGTRPTGRSGRWAARSRSPTPSRRLGFWNPIGTESSRKPSRCCPKPSGRRPSAARRGMSTGSTTPSTARPGSSG